MVDSVTELLCMLRSLLFVYAYYIYEKVKLVSFFFRLVLQVCQGHNFRMTTYVVKFPKVGLVVRGSEIYREKHWTESLKPFPCREELKKHV